MSSKKYTIPKFDGSNYKRWKLLVGLWNKVTDVAEEKRGAALILNMSGSALDIALSIDPDNTTVKNVLDIMDKVYVEENDLSIKVDEFDQLMRKKDQNMKEFIHTYEQKVNELKAGRVEIPDIVLATKLLRAADLLPNHYLISRSSCSEMTFENAKAALLRITEKCPTKIVKPEDSSSSDMIKIKEEVLDYDQSETLYLNNNTDIHRSQFGNSLENEVCYAQSGKFYGRGQQQPDRRPNNLRQCFGCGSNTHWLKDCPNKSRSKQAERLCYGCGDSTHWIKDCPYLQEIHSIVQSIKSKSENTYGNQSSQSKGKEKLNNSYQRTFVVGNEENSISQCQSSDHDIVPMTEEKDKNIFFQSDVGNEIEDILLVGQTVNNVM